MTGVFLLSVSYALARASRTCDVLRRDLETRRQPGVDGYATPNAPGAEFHDYRISFASAHGADDVFGMVGQDLFLGTE